MAENQTCFQEVEFNEVLQDKIIKSVFDKLATCTDEQTLKNNINLILQEKSEQGFISLEPLRKSNDVQTQVNLLLECSLSEATKLIDQNIKIDAAYVISGINKFICNPPSFDFPSINLSFKFSLKDLFIKLLFQFVDLLTQLLLQIIQQILNVVLNICETNFESLLQGYQNINNILSSSFEASINFKINDITSSLQPLFRTFGFNSDGTLIESPNFISCESNIGSIRPVNQFLNDLSMMITPFEICSLFEGVPSQQTLELIKELLQFEYPLLQTRLSDNDIITNFFVSLGRFVPPSICRNIRETYTDEYAYNCGEEYSQREQVKLSILNRNGHTEEQSREVIRRERERYSNRLRDLGSFVAKLRNDPDKVFDSVPSNIFCKSGKAGMASLSDIPSAVKTTRTIVNGFYNPLKSAHYNDSLNIQDLYFKKETVRRKSTRFCSESNPEIINGVTYTSETQEKTSYKRLQALGNPIYYTNKLDYALEVEEKVQRTRRLRNTDGTYSEIPIEGSYTTTSRVISLDEEQLNVQDDGYLTNRWVADINKITADGASKTQPIGILEELQLSNLNEYQSMNLEFDYNNNSISNTQLKFESIQNSINQNKPEDNSIVTINKIYRNPATSLNSNQRQQYNSFINREYGIDNPFTTNNTLLYDNSDITTGPFRQPTDLITQQLKQIVPNPVKNESLQIQAFKTITGLSSRDYYKIFNDLILRMSLFSTIVQEDPNYKEIKDTILIIPFERIIGINKVKNTTLTAYLNDPCAISQDIQKQDEISLFNTYLVESAIKLLVRTFCLKNDLKDLLSLVKINPYTFVNNDDTYIEFLLQTFKQDLRRLSGGDYFYNQVIMYIEKSVDKILELEGVLVDSISGQQINLEEELTTDFKIRFFIKQEYADMLVRLENIFVSSDTQRQINFDYVKGIMRRTIQSTTEIPVEFDNLFFEYIFPVSKISSIVKINNIISMTTNYDNSNDTYNTTLQTLKSMILNFTNVEPNFVDCNSNLPSFDLNIPNINGELIKQFLIRAPIEIVKGMAENFDPNIRVANPIRRLTESFTGNNLPCLPFSLALLPIGTVPFGFGPPILPPWGFTYLFLDTAEYLLTPAEKNKRLKFALELGKFDKLEDLFEKDENC